MSKKCCGIIYSGNEKRCNVCGKKLAKLPDYDESLENSEDISEDLPLDELSDDYSDEITDLDVAYEEPESYYNSEEVTEIYSDSPAEEPFLDPLAAKALDQVFSDDIVINPKKKKKKKELDSNVPSASKALKFVGTISLTLAILGIGIVFLFVYFMAVKPYYDKTDKTFPLNYDHIATGQDAETMAGELEMMSTPSDATASDASESDSAREVE